MNETMLWPLPVSIAVFVGGAVFTIGFGIRLSQAGDELADRTGLGEAVFGSVFFGGIISLSGIVMTATAAGNGQASLAYSNAVGGVAAQILALGIADIAYRRVNLEHAAASLPNAVFAVVLGWLLCIALLASFAPPITLFQINIASLVLVAVYIFGLHQVRATRSDPQWHAKQTDQTVEDRPEARSEQSSVALWADFVLSGLAVSACGWAIARAAISLVQQLGLDASFVGAFLMGTVNAIPETVTAVAAVRTGALTLAVGGILGGNAFDVLNLAAGDVAYRSGSLYHAADRDDLFVTLTSLLMTLIVLGGLLRRERRGPLGIGFEGVALGAVYALMAVITIM